MSTPNGQSAGTSTDPGAGANGAAAPDPVAELQAKLAAQTKTARDANAEAAALRKDAVAWREHQTSQQSAEAQWTAKNAELETRATKAEIALARVRAAVTANLPLDMAPRLQGTNEAELATDAAALAKMLAGANAATAQSAADAAAAARRAPDPSQAGANGAAPLPLNGDPIQASVERLLGIRR